MELNKKVYMSTLKYIISRCENKVNVGKTVICKLLYFSDFNYYEIYETPLTNETYLKYERGPYPSHIDNVLDELIGSGVVIRELKPYSNSTMYKYYLNKAPDLGVLTTEMLSVINDVIDSLSSKNANEISEYSHGDMPWLAAEDNEELDYEFVFYRDDDYSVRKYEE